SDIAKRIGNFFKLPILLFYTITYPELALIFQNGTSNWGGTRKLPYAFTEQGLAMLSGLLNSDIAIKVNINIMRAFVAIRQMITDNSPLKRLSTLEKNFNELKQDLEKIFADYNDINEDTRAQIEAINTTLAELQAKPKNTPRSPVGFIKPKE
uniref:ORF6N domain-containing protein n=1 Tax=uncultured Muribaculum sp. TaxID=1918613 RepID=UPI00338E849A